MKNTTKIAKTATKTKTKKAPAIAPETTTPTPTPTPTPTTLEEVKEPVENEVEVTLVQDGGAKRYVSKTDPDSKYHLRNRSTAVKPCHVVREICAENPDLTRKEIIAMCIEEGVDKNTAATQYSLWKAKQVKAPVAVAVEGDINPDDFEDVTIPSDEDGEE